MSDPQQEIYTALLVALRDGVTPVYDGFLPPQGTPYPFIYMGDVAAGIVRKKSGETGTVKQTVHVWHSNPHKRGSVSAILMDIKRAADRIKETPGGYGWDIVDVSEEILPDTTTATPLLHGVVTLTFSYSKGRS
jgi:hypothetical protein